jgi:hypothetical protein
MKPTNKIENWFIFLKINVFILAVYDLLLVLAGVIPEI